MQPGGDLEGKPLLRLHRRAREQRRDLHAREVREQREVVAQRGVRDRHHLAEQFVRWLVDADVVAERLRHLLVAVGAGEERQRDRDLRTLAVLALELAAGHQVEELVAAADLHVGLHRDRVVGLHQRVEELADVDRVVALEAAGEIVALQELRHREVRGEAQHLAEVELAEPVRVAPHDRALPVQDAEDLVHVGAAVRLDLLRGEHRAGLVLVRGVADEAGEVADQERHLVAEVLEGAQLTHRQRVAEVQIDRRRVVAAVDAQRAALGEPLAQLALHRAPRRLVPELGAAHDRGELLLYGCAHANQARVSSTSRRICAISASGPSNFCSGRSRCSNSTEAIAVVEVALEVQQVRLHRTPHPVEGGAHADVRAALETAAADLGARGVDAVGGKREVGAEAEVDRREADRAAALVAVNDRAAQRERAAQQVFRLRHQSGRQRFTHARRGDRSRRPPAAARSAAPRSRGRGRVRRGAPACPRGCVRGRSRAR